MDLHILGRKGQPQSKRAGPRDYSRGEKWPGSSGASSRSSVWWPKSSPMAGVDAACFSNPSTPGPPGDMARQAGFKCDCVQLCVWLWVSWVFYPAFCKFCSSASIKSKTHRQTEMQIVYIRLVIPVGGKCRLLFPVCTPLPTFLLHEVKCLCSLNCNGCKTCW